MESSDLVAAVEQVVRRLQREGLPHADAEDCVHEALLALLVRHGDPETEPVTAVPAWLTVTARRKQLDRLRRADREQRALIHPRATPPAAPDPAEIITDQALAAWLVRALNQLPEHTRQVCGAMAAGIGVDETADRLGLTRRSVQSHLTRARRLLRHLAAGAAITLAGALAATLARLTRHTSVATAAAPVALATATAISVILLPHYTPLPQQVALPPGAVQTPPPSSGPAPVPVQIPAQIVEPGTDPPATPAIPPTTEPVTSGNADQHPATNPPSPGATPNTSAAPTTTPDTARIDNRARPANTQPARIHTGASAAQPITRQVPASSTGPRTTALDIPVPANRSPVPGTHPPVTAPTPPVGNTPLVGDPAAGG